MTQKTVLLTGFAGFIGSQILKDLIYNGYKVIGVDNFSEGSNINNFKNSNHDFSFTYIKQNIEDLTKQDILNMLGDIKSECLNYIISCAAQSHVDRCYNQVDKFISSNINGPINLAKLALNLKIEKFAHVSTDEIWAESIQPFTEHSLVRTGNAYASSKASAELFLYNYYKAFGLPLVITNGANTYGPNQSIEKVIPKTIYNIVNGVKIPLYKTRAQRMWMHVEDHSQGIISAMEKGVIGEKYCLAPDQENELYTDELIRLICEICGVKFDDVVEYVEDRPNYDLRYWMLNNKAKQELGWNPWRKIEEELPELVTYYIQRFSK